MENYKLSGLTELFEAHADPDRARQMRAYMKEQFDYLGLPSPLRRDLARQFFAQNSYPPVDQLGRIVNDCYAMPFREYKYFSLELLVKMRKKAGHDAIHLYESLLGIEPWWDTVDLIAPSLVGQHFQVYPEERQAYIRKWIASGDMWLQRSCVIFQLKYKDKTDTRLLTEVILQLNDSKEFFIRKAIGWALREYSKTNPGFVIDFVQAHPLSGLSRREAMKRIESR